VQPTKKAESTITK